MPGPSRRVRVLHDRLYPPGAVVDERRRFAEVVLGLLQPGDRLLELGPGIADDAPWRGLGHPLWGVDPDPRTADLAGFTRVVTAPIEEAGIPDAGFDLAVARFVLEHLPQPERTAAAVARALRPGGHLVLLTPNRWHYVPLVARFAPMGIHRVVARHQGRGDGDAHPTFYRANTVPTLERIFGAVGFEPLYWEAIEPPPHYLNWSAPGFLIGAAWQRLLARSARLAPLRAVILGVFRRR